MMSISLLHGIRLSRFRGIERGGGGFWGGLGGIGMLVGGMLWKFSSCVWVLGGDMVVIDCATP